MKRWLCVCVLVGCTADPTGVSLTIESDGSLDQLRIEVNEPMLGPELVPPEPAELRLEESVSLLVSSSLDGTELDVAVEGLMAGVARVRGDGRVTVVAGEFVDLRIVLGSSDCAAETCEGCCGVSGCEVVGFPNCGVRSDHACEACDARADRCSPEGECVCGEGPACALGQACSDGVCGCGESTCLSESGACEPTGWPTCSDEGECENCNLTRSDRCLDGGCSCGTQGRSCPNGETCVDGECRCGDEVCAPGQRCFLDTMCVCDRMSCGDGCCDADNQCQPGNTNNACGRRGNACDVCSGGEVCDAAECD